MHLFITGICGFVASTMAARLLAQTPGLTLSGIDNLARPGAQVNVGPLKKLGVKVVHGDVRSASDLEAVTGIDWIIDAAALPSVLAGVDGKTTPRQLVEHNLIGTVNLLELARRCRAGLVLISTSRVYSVVALSRIPVKPAGDTFVFDDSKPAPAGVSAAGIAETFSTAAPVSLYGATKLASEIMAFEYGQAFDLPVWVNRCGVLAGGGQFGTPEQGIFSYWVRAYAERRKLRYIGFDGHGRQVRDALHPDDLADLIAKQIARGVGSAEPWNVGGGAAAAMSLAQLSAWSAARFGAHDVASEPKDRLYDAGWIVMDAAKASHEFDWRPQRSMESILTEIADHHASHPNWLDLSA